MPMTARVGDLHQGICGHGKDCCPHSVIGPIIVGSSDTNANGNPVARLGDAVVHNCPHCGTGMIVGGSSTILTNGKPTARIGDPVVYPGGAGVIIQGSPDVMTGG